MRASKLKVMKRNIYDYVEDPEELALINRLQLGIEDGDPGSQDFEDECMNWRDSDDDTPPNVDPHRLDD